MVNLRGKELSWKGNAGDHYFENGNDFIKKSLSKWTTHSKMPSLRLHPDNAVKFVRRNASPALHMLKQKPGCRVDRIE